MYFKNTTTLVMNSILMLCIGAYLSACNNNSNSPKNVDSTLAEIRNSDIKNGGDTTKKTISNFQYDSTKKYVFLTFDDGPQPGTMEVYHAIEETGVKATFFMVGLHETFAKSLTSVVDTIRSSYPNTLLANHSYTHAFNDRYFNFYHHPYLALNDFMKAEESLKATHKIMRLPGNDAWVLDSSHITAAPLVKPLCKLFDSTGAKVMGWDVEWHFKRNPHGSGQVPVQSAQAMANAIIYAMENNHGHRKNTVVMLSHDRLFHLPNYKDSLVTMIQILQKAHPEYVYETADHYPGFLK
ncbi:polysaccharide deacetylase family protein [Rhizosphaericola mali]|uniref:Polysaccharide deacetylase family protein n=2 Tax=Rhizosphaericola mali TaxID=2545455 RepID=A0A5P2G3D7_9BACT|nr:polysaccharide deacetylase family protein [Rhizosphaericola mali]